MIVFYKLPYTVHPKQRWACKLVLKVQKSQVRKFLGSFRYKFLKCFSPQTENPQIVMIIPQIATPQVSTKYCKTLSRKSPKSRI